MTKPFLICLMLAISCSNATASDSPEKLRQRFVAAVKAMDTDAIAKLYANDAVMFPVDEMKGVGPEFVKNSWAGFFSAFSVNTVALVDTHEENFGDSAVSWGFFEMGVVPVGGGDEIVMKGRFMDLSHNFDGTWKYVVDHASSPLPPPPEE